MNNVYFAIYNPEDDCIEVYTKDNLKIIFNCTRLNNNGHPYWCSFVIKQ